MVTMADVAKHAGVSVSTVSHVVNGTRSLGQAPAIDFIDMPVLLREHYQ